MKVLGIKFIIADKRKKIWVKIVRLWLVLLSRPSYFFYVGKGVSAWDKFSPPNRLINHENQFFLMIKFQLLNRKIKIRWQSCFPKGGG